MSIEYLGIPIRRVGNGAAGKTGWRATGRSSGCEGRQPVAPRPLAPAAGGTRLRARARAIACAVCLIASTGQLRAQDVLPGTASLVADGDLAARMVEEIDQFLLQMTRDSVAQRARHWRRDISSHAAYAKSVEPNRQRLRRIVGVVDERVAFESPSILATLAEASQQQRAKPPPPPVDVISISWPVLPGVDGQGLLYVPREPPVADVIVLDADRSEKSGGGAEWISTTASLPLDLATAGCRVLVPQLIDRQDTFSVAGQSRATNQPHREFIYRQAYELGRHIIGYEVQKVLAAVDWFSRERAAAESANNGSRKIGLCGYGEGGLLALYAAAIDPRIDVTCVSGYFGPREQLWREPIYRNVWSLLDEFGDAELASLITPRALIIEAAEVPRVDGPPAARDGRSGAAPGELRTPALNEIAAEADRARQLTAGLSPALPLTVLVADGGHGWPGRSETLDTLLALLNPEFKPPRSTRDPATNVPRSPSIEPQFRQLVDFSQHLMRQAENRRAEFWKNADKSSVEAWQKSCDFYRQYFYEEVIGRIDQPLLPPQPRTRRVYDEPKYTGYEVQLDVFPGVFAYGILLLPKDIQPGQRRPVVVCQHGLEGCPQDVADPHKNHPAYNQFACRLAERGFITYAPQNPYIGEHKFRTLQRKANPLKLSLFSFIVPQHEQTTAWLASLPMVDPQRIAFYGLSYGGKTAMRVPPLVDRYCLSICSADFNEWIWKNASATSPYSYLGTGEYEIFEFDLGNSFNYAEMAGLIAPRPFMVERGHHDGVAPDEWVAYEYAKVRRLYTALKIPHRTEIEFFDGPHSIHGVGTFDFLHRHLRWPSP